jgi:serine/threonine protein kinase/tetratricopeptide (TPR) repeat protein
MGVVYAALNPRGQPCALKLLLDMDDVIAVERFKREAHAARRLRHPHLIEVLDFGVAEGHPYLVMPLLDGLDLRERLRGGPLPVEDVVQIGIALADGLAHAHALGILHRDLKPENVIMRETGPVLTDFGLAKPLLDHQSLTQTGHLVGTPAYMAPEQAQGDKGRIGVATDVYGLGALLYALLVGSAPFRGPTTLMVLNEVIETPPPPPSSLREGVPAWLEACVLRCLAKEPAERFEDMVQLRDALSGGAAPPSQQPPGSGKGRALLIAAALASLLFLGVVASGLLRPPGAPPSATPSSPADSPGDSASVSPSVTPSALQRPGRYSREALRERLQIPAGVNAVDHVYDQVVLQLQSPRAFGLRWLDEGAERTRDPELRLAWALVLSQGLGKTAAAAPICSEVAAALGETPRLRVVRGFANFRHAKPGWALAEMEKASADPAAPRYVVGLHALTLLREQKLDAAIAIAERGAREGDPGAASVLATCHRQRAQRGSQAALREARQAYAKAEELSLELFGELPTPWATDYAELLYTSGDYDEGARRFKEAITRATWTARPANLFVQLVRARLPETRDKALRKTLVEQIKETLSLAASRSSGVAQTREILVSCEAVGAHVGPALFGLSEVRLPLYERRLRAELVVDYLDLVEPEVWSRALEDLNASLAQETLSPSQRLLLLLARLRVRRRVMVSPAQRAGPDEDDHREAASIQAGGRKHDVAWAWFEFERGGAGLEAALKHLERALSKRPENWPRLVALRAEIQLYLGRPGKSEADRRLLSQLAAKRHPANRTRRAKLCVLYLRGILAMSRGEDERARAHFAKLNSARPRFYRADDAQRWEGLALARLGKGRLVRAVSLGSYLSELGLALEVLRAATLTQNRNDKQIAALKTLAARWPGSTILRRWALDLAKQ